MKPHRRRILQIQKIVSIENNAGWERTEYTDILPDLREVYGLLKEGKDAHYCDSDAHNEATILLGKILEVEE